MKVVSNIINSETFPPCKLPKIFQELPQYINHIYQKTYKELQLKVSHKKLQATIGFLEIAPERGIPSSYTESVSSGTASNKSPTRP